MNKFLIGAIAATLVATPSLAASWRTELFSRLDTDTSGELTVSELEQTGCHVDRKLFNYADADRNSALNNREFFNNRNLFSRCK